MIQSIQNDGRPIYIGDGVIPQVERFASKYAYSKLTVAVLNTVIAMLNEKAENPTGNVYMFICNEKFYQELTDALGAYLAQFQTDGTYLYSMKANGTVEVNGGHFNSYKYLGNQLTFKVDRTFSREYGLINRRSLAA